VRVRLSLLRRRAHQAAEATDVDSAQFGDYVNRQGQPKVNNNARSERVPTRTWAPALPAQHHNRPGCTCRVGPSGCRSLSVWRKSGGWPRCEHRLLGPNWRAWQAYFIEQFSRRNSPAARPRKTLKAHSVGIESPSVRGARAAAAWARRIISP